jgi:hypothetical protein
MPGKLDMTAVSSAKKKSQEMDWFSLVDISQGAMTVSSQSPHAPSAPQPSSAPLKSIEYSDLIYWTLFYIFIISHFNTI